MSAYWLGLEVAEVDRAAFEEMAEKHLGGDEWDEADTINGSSKMIMHEASFIYKLGIEQMTKDADCPPFAYMWEIDDTGHNISGVFMDGQHLTATTNDYGEIEIPLSLKPNGDTTIIDYDLLAKKYLFLEQKNLFDEYVKAKRIIMADC